MAIPEPPPGTQALFGECWPAVLAYTQLLCTLGVTAGVIGPREIERVWTRHIRNSLAVSPFIPQGSDVIDLGSGAGLPGIPLALARPDLRVTLLEPLARRTRFLERAVAECDVPCAIVQGRAESSELRSSVIVARAVAPLTRLLPLARRLGRPNGCLVALKGAGLSDEILAVKAAGIAGTELADTAGMVVSEHTVYWPDEARIAMAVWQG